MFSDLELVLLITSGATAAMTARYFALRFVERRHYSERRRTILVMTPMFAAMFLVLNAFWMSLSWRSLIEIPIVTIFQIVFMLPFLIAVAFIPTSFRSKARNQEQDSSE